MQAHLRMRQLLHANLLLSALCCSAQAVSSDDSWYQTHHGRRLAEDLAPGAKACPDGCAKNGVCNPEIGECMCSRLFTGPACEQALNDTKATCLAWGFTSTGACNSESASACLNGCHGRGKCIGGFCHCQQGYYGSECSLSLRASDGKPELLAGLNYTVRSRGPRIYVYELPGHYNMHKNVYRIDRPLHLLFLQRLTGAGVRVANADEADYFFIPVKLRMYGDGEGLISAIQYIRQRWPYWDKWHGHRHLVMQTGDMGRAETSTDARAVSTNVTFLTHWGLYENQPRGGWPKSHRPGKDIVVPIFIQPALVDTYGMHTTPLHPIHAKPRDDSLQFFFAGRICHDRKPPLLNVFPNCDIGTHMAGQGYSAGTRQKVFYYHGNRTGYKVVTHTKTYAEDMASARFCLAPTGSGHGKRNTLVTLLGCVPATMTDYVLQPFEPELDWSTFSIPVLEKDIPDMNKVLDAINAQGYEKLQKSLRCAAQHLFWSSIYGSIMGEDGRFDAFEATMAILQARLKHPDAAPEQLAKLDPELDAFMKCQPPPGSSDVAPARHLCTNTPADGAVAQCKAGIVRTPLGIQGGAMCKDAVNIAQCHRVWT